MPKVRTSENSSSETVWKIADGSLDGVCSMAQDCEMVLLYPHCPLMGPQTGGYPDFPNSFSPTFRKQGRERPKLLRPDLPIGLRDALVDEGREVASVPLLDLR
jgi:hypothetical protein